MAVIDQATPSDESQVKARAREKLRRDLGETIVGALNDPRTVEVLLNADGMLWRERLGEPMEPIGTMAPAKAEAVIKTVAGFHSKEVTRHSPLVEAELPLDGSRFAGQLPPVVSAPTFAIRKRAIAVFTLADYVANGIVTPAHCAALIEAVQQHRNILVVGGTGSGKTTLVNAIIREMVETSPQEGG